MTTAVLNTKISEVENKIPSVNDLVKKKNYDAKLSETENKFLIYSDSISDYNKFTSDIIDAKAKQKESFNKSTISNLEKHLEAFDSSCFHGKNLFGDDGFQNIFVYQPTFNTLELKKDKGTEFVIDWK